MAKSEYLGLNIDQTLKKLKVKFKELEIQWNDEFEHTDYYDFMLSHKWWYVLCKIDKVYPYNTKFRLIWIQKYTSVKIDKFVEAVKGILLDRFIPKEETNDTTELQK